DRRLDGDAHHYEFHSTQRRPLCYDSPCVTFDRFSPVEMRKKLIANGVEERCRSGLTTLPSLYATLSRHLTFIAIRWASRPARLKMFPASKCVSPFFPWVALVAVRLN